VARALGLVLDLAFAGFVAVTDSEGHPLVRHWRPPGARYDDIAEWIHDGLAEAGGVFSDLAWICVGVGPGSFTGIRIAMAFAQGLALPGELPLYGFTSFAPLLLSGTSPAEGLSEERRLAIIPANTGRFYAASDLQDPGRLVDAEEGIRLADSETILSVPSITASLNPILPGFKRVHSVEDRWDVLALVDYARTSSRDAYHPYYLQLSAAEAKLPGSI